MLLAKEMKALTFSLSRETGPWLIYTLFFDSRNNSLNRVGSDHVCQVAQNHTVMKILLEHLLVFREI